MLDDFHERCLLNIASDSEKATYNRVKARLKNLMPSDKGHTYQTLQRISEEVSYPELMLAIAELAILSGQVPFGQAVLDFLAAQQSNHLVKK